MSKAPRGEHSFQPAGAGKGDADRTSDVEAFRTNYDEIDWGRSGIIQGVDDRPLHYNAKDGTITTLDQRKPLLHFAPPLSDSFWQGMAGNWGD